MIRRFRSIFSVLLFLTAFPVSAGPFGLDQGMSLEQIKKLTPLESGDKPFFYEAKALPLGGKEVEFYFLMILPKAGLCSIRAIIPVLTEQDGSTMKIEFNLYANILREKYGTPIRQFDFLRSSSPWRDSKDWMRALKQGDRTLQYFWESSKNKKLTNSLHGISLTALAFSSTSAGLIVQYDFENIRQCETEISSEIKLLKRSNTKGF